MISRRGLIMAILAAPTSANGSANGFTVRGRFDATDTERTEQMVNVGKAFAWICHDKALWNQLDGLIGQNVIIRVDAE